jgi:hypothetical protein
VARAEAAPASAEEQPRPVKRQADKQLAQIAPMPVLFELDEQRGHVSAHVVKNLALKVLPVAPVGMKDNGARLIAAGLTTSQQVVPKLGVSAAARGADVQALIEPAKDEESLAPKRHVGASADDPSRSAPRACLTGEVRREKNRLVAPVKAPKRLESHLRFSGQRIGKSGTGHGPD